MMTLRELIYTSFREAKITESGEYVTNEELEAEAILALQNILSSWSTQKLLMPFKTIETFEIIPNKALYTIGPSADFDTQNPDSIVDAYITISQDKDVYLDEISQQEYFKIYNKKYIRDNGPEKYFFDYQYPHSGIYFWPVSNKQLEITFSFYKPYEWINVVNIDEPVPAPTPYLNAMISHLTLKLCTEHGTEIPPGVVNSAQQSLINLTQLTQETISALNYDSIFKYNSQGKSWI